MKFNIIGVGVILITFFTGCYVNNTSAQTGSEVVDSVDTGSAKSEYDENTYSSSSNSSSVSSNASSSSEENPLPDPGSSSSSDDSEVENGEDLEYDPIVDENETSTSSVPYFDGLPESSSGSSSSTGTPLPEA